MSRKQQAIEEFCDGAFREFVRVFRATGQSQVSARKRRSEYDCSITQHEDCFILLVWGMEYKVEFFRREDVYLMIRATKPEARHGKTYELKGVKKLLGVSAFLQTGKSASAANDKLVMAFCCEHKDLLKQLNLSGPEDLGIMDSCVRFRWRGTEMESLRPRLEAFAHLIRELSGMPEPDPMLFEREWRLQPLPKSAPQKSSADHHYGGRLTRAIGCPECDEAVTLIAQLDLSDLSLPKTAMGRIKLPVFSCRGCLDWGPAFYDVSGVLPQILDTNGKIIKRKKPTENEEDLPRQPFVITPVTKGRKAGKTSKVGGAPRWIHGSETPSCPKCRNAMAFVMQMAEDSQVEFGDAGLLYTFACPKCKVVASMIQSY
jgi:hypothetical protein